MCGIFINIGCATVAEVLLETMFNVEVGDSDDEKELKREREATLDILEDRGIDPDSEKGKQRLKDAEWDVRSRQQLRGMYESSETAESEIQLV